MATICIFMGSEEEVRQVLQDVLKKKHHKKLFSIIILFVLAIISIVVVTQTPLLSFGSSPFKQEDVAFISQSDLDSQGHAKNITGYDWTNFLNADGSDNAKISALLFLANEIDALDSNFRFVNRSVGVSVDELPSRLNATDNSKGNLLKLIGNIRGVNDVFLSKGLESVKIRANRLSVIENFFSRYALPGGEISSDVADIFAEKLGLTVDDYPRLISLMIVNYNLFLAE